MSDESRKIHFGNGILRPGTRSIKGFVDKSGEYWLCDANVDPQSDDFRAQGCVDHSRVQMAEGG